MSFTRIPNSSRGHVSHGWLKTAHSFSFARYVNPERMNFGALLVLNEDTIAPGAGFGKHFHDNMEIVTIPLSGALRHEDSMGTSAVISTGDVQIMSAGTGIMHSEVNASSTEPVHLLQIWITPNRNGLPTRYDQLTTKTPSNTLVPVVTPHPIDGALVIHQDAWFHLGTFEAGHEQAITLKDKEHGAFLFVIAGNIRVNGETFDTGDALEVRDETAFTFSTLEASKVLVVEVPLQP